MTRKEALSHIRLIMSYDGSFDESDAENLVNKIFDDFESRSCKNCKWFKNTTECRHPHNKQYYYCDGEFGMPMSVSKDFCCNKFERS